MTGRTAIETLIHETYAARCRGDLDGLMSNLHPECSYRLIGAAQVAPMCGETCGHTAVRSQMADLIRTFVFSDVEPLSLTVDGDRAAYRWRAKVTFTPNGRSEDVDIIELIEIADGKVRRVEEFTDTTVVMRLTSA